MSVFVCFVSASGVWIKFIHLDFRMCVLLQSWGTDRKVSWNYCTQSQVRLTAFDCVEIMPRYQRCGGDVVWSTWWLPRSRGTGSNFRVLGLLELSIHWWIITKNHFVDVLKCPKSHLTRSHGVGRWHCVGGFVPSGTGGTQWQFGCPSHLLHRGGPRPGPLISSWLPLKTHCKNKAGLPLLAEESEKGNQIVQKTCWSAYGVLWNVGSFPKTNGWNLIKQPAVKRWLRVPSLCSGKKVKFWPLQGRSIKDRQAEPGTPMSHLEVYVGHGLGK